MPSTRLLRVAASPATSDILAEQFATFGYRTIRHNLAGTFEDEATADSCEALIVESTGTGNRARAVVSTGARLWPGAAIILIDRSDELVDRILALEAGADDCIGWPCDSRELLARIRAIRRRGASENESRGAIDENEECNAVRFSGWVLDRLQRRLTDDHGTTEVLPAAEFAVIDRLVRQPRKIVSRESLLQATAPSGAADPRHSRAIDIQVSRLRKRIETGGEEIIRTVRGRGYMLLSAVSPA